MLDFLFDNVAGLHAYNCIKMKLQHVFFRVIFESSFYRTSPVAASAVFCKHFVDISRENALFHVLEYSIWLQLIYF